MGAVVTAAVVERSAKTFAALVAEAPADAWDGPGLGAWDLRSLVGHTSRSLITVEEYLRLPAAQVDCASAADYYVVVQTIVAADPGAVVERGRQAGRDLGADPSAAVEALVTRVLPLIDRDDDPVITTLAGGMRLSDYLPTRVVELVVHSQDIARALERPAPEIDDETQQIVLDVLIASARRRGLGPSLLKALTGRGGLPEDFSVV